MDFISTRAIEVTKLAMDGLYARQKAIAANTANVTTPNYQRQDVAFENQLQSMIERDDLRRTVRATNLQPMQYSPTSLEEVIPRYRNEDNEQIQKFLSEKEFTDYQPEMITDTKIIDGGDSGNVNVEKEMMDMAKTGLQYNALATIENKMLTQISDVIKTGGNV